MSELVERLRATSETGVAPELIDEVVERIAALEASENADIVHYKQLWQESRRKVAELDATLSKVLAADNAKLIKIRELEAENSRLQELHLKRTRLTEKLQARLDAMEQAYSEGIDYGYFKAALEPTDELALWKLGRKKTEPVPPDCKGCKKLEKRIAALEALLNRWCEYHTDGLYSDDLRDLYLQTLAALEPTDEQ